MDKMSGVKISFFIFAALSIGDMVSACISAYNKNETKTLRYSVCSIGWAQCVILVLILGKVS